MSDKHTKSDARLSGGVHGKHRADNDEYMPKSVWQPSVVRRLADYIRQLREVDDESNKRAVARQPGQSAQPEQSRHVCPRHPYRTCNCPAGACADDDATYRLARGPFVATDPNQRIPAPEPNELGNFRCPINGLVCGTDACREFCTESGGTGAAPDTDRGDAKAADNS